MTKLLKEILTLSIFCIFIIFLLSFIFPKKVNAAKNPTPLVQIQKCDGLRTVGYCCPMDWTVRECVERRNLWLKEKEKSAGRAVGRAVKKTNEIGSRLFEGLRKTLEENK